MSEQTLAVVFPGQGSQKIGMLADLHDKWPSVQETFAAASEVLKYDLWALIQNGQQEELNLTEKAQPALLASSYATWKILSESDSFAPTVLAGHSLGEWSALVCAGVLQFGDAIKLVQLRGQYMQAAVPVGVGTMAAIVGLDDQVVIDCCAKAAGEEVVSAVNFNSPGQVVIAGHTAAVEKASALCTEAGAKRAMMLPVSAPFHSSLMKPAADNLAKHIEDTSFSAPKIPVIHNVNVETEDSGDNIKQLMVQQIFSPVRWVETIQAFEQRGVTDIVECGPGKVLTGLTKRIVKGFNSHSTGSVGDVEKFLG